MPQTWGIVSFNSHFHLTGLWKQKQSHSAVIQLFSWINPGQWSSAGFAAAKNLADLGPISAGFHTWTGFGQLCLAHQPSLFPDPTPYGVWGKQRPRNPTGAVSGVVHMKNTINNSKPTLFTWIRPLHTGLSQTQSWLRRCLVWLLEKQNPSHIFL